MQKIRLNLLGRQFLLKTVAIAALWLLSPGLPGVRAQSAALIFRDDFKLNNLGSDWYAPYSWSVLKGAAYNYVDGTGGVLKTTDSFAASSYVIETSGKGFTRNRYREFRITFGQTDLVTDSGYVLSYTPYSGGQLTLTRTTDNIYYGDVLDEVSLSPDLASTRWYTFKIAKYKSGLIQVYLDKGDGYPALPLLEAIDHTYPHLGHFGWQVDTDTAPEDFYVDWIAVARPLLEKPAVPEKPLEDDLITQVTAASGQPHQVAKLKTGEKQYTDREYTITSLPAYLKGASFIQTSMEDKSNAGEISLSFFLKKNVILYVAYDPRATHLPGWLSDWRKTGDIIGTTDPGSPYLEVYSKLVEYPQIYPNPVSLGGNLATPAAGAEMNYLVAAVEPPASIKLEAEAATLSGAEIATNYTGYSDTGFADYINLKDDYIEWSVEIATPGDYSLGLNYSNGTAPSRALNFALDGAWVFTYAFESTGSWETWAFYGGPTVYLNRGTHTIRAKAIGDSGPNVDYLSLNYLSPGSLNAPARVAFNPQPKAALPEATSANNRHRVNPNPFTDNTTVAYDLTEPTPVYLALYNLQGHQLKTLVNENQAAGTHVVKVDGQVLPPGVYVYRLQTGNHLSVGKVIKQ